MAAPETPKALGPCPTDEDLAAFLDGMLPAAERARITAHLADCESCYEIFAGAVHFQQETSGMGGRDRSVLPFPFRKNEPHVRPLQWTGFAAAAVLVIGVGFASYRLYFAEPKVMVAGLVEHLAGRPGLAEQLDSSAYRGGGSEGGILTGPPAFMLGARLVDLQLSLALGRSGNAGNLLRDMSRYLEQIPGFDDDAKRCVQDVSTLENHDSPQVRRRIAEAWRSKEVELDEDFLPSNFGFGKWAEAGRLSAATRTPDFFTSWNNRRFLHKLLKNSAEVEEDAVSSLRTIGAVWDRGDLHEKDYSSLADKFRQIIEVYRQQAADPEN